MACGPPCLLALARRRGHLAPLVDRPPLALQIAGQWREAATEWDSRTCPYEERLGARPAAARVSRRLRELGVRDIPRGPRPATRANPARLTAREAEVVRLVALGIRNGEIAERLGVPRAAKW